MVNDWMRTAGHCFPTFAAAEIETPRQPRTMLDFEVTSSPQRVRRACMRGKPDEITEDPEFEKGFVITDFVVSGAVHYTSRAKSLLLRLSLQSVAYVCSKDCRLARPPVTAELLIRGSFG